MIRKTAVLRAALSIIVSLFFITTQAQPLLPDMAGITEKGVNILTWTCQYAGIKSIAVQRSSDSLMNFSTVGYVRNLQKGVQVFADGHPLPGYNYYQLVIVFSSDLSWTSNRIKMYVDSATIKRQRLRLPSNDSLQRYITTHIVKDDNTTPPVAAKEEQPVKPVAKKRKHKNDDEEEEQQMEEEDTTEVMQPTLAGSGKPRFDPNSIGNETTPYSPYGSVGPKKKKTVIVVGAQSQHAVTSLDSSLIKVIATNDSLVKKQPKIAISLVTDAAELNSYDYVKSEYVFTDEVSGNIDITLPDVKGHYYTMRIYNHQNNMVLEVPHFSSSPVIMDKRNFHESGLYKFILRRDNKEFETGFVSVNLE